MIGEMAGAGITTAANIYMANKQNKANEKAAQKQMDFQREMSNTAHQREAADLQAAGLNRILSLGSGASTPGGASANYVAPQISDFGNTVSSAKAAKTAKLQQEQQNSAIQSGINKTNSDIGVNKNTMLLQDAQKKSAEASTLSTVQQAKRIALDNRALEAQLPAMKAKADFEAKNAHILLPAQAVGNIASQALGGVTDALNIFNLMKKPRNQSETTENYDAKGEHTGSTIRTRKTFKPGF